MKCYFLFVPDRFADSFLWCLNTHQSLDKYTIMGHVIYDASRQCRALYHWLAYARHAHHAGLLFIHFLSTAVHIQPDEYWRQLELLNLRHITYVRFGRPRTRIDCNRYNNNDWRRAFVPLAGAANAEVVGVCVWQNTFHSFIHSAERQNLLRQLYEAADCGPLSVVGSFSQDKCMPWCCVADVMCRLFNYTR